MDGQCVEKHTGMALGSMLLQSCAQENMSVPKAVQGGQGDSLPLPLGVYL